MLVHVLYGLTYYYLRMESIYPTRPFPHTAPHASSQGVYVQYMDRARGHTVDIFTQTLPGTLSTTAKLSSLTHFFTRGAHMLDHKRTTHSSICELSVLCQLRWVVNEAEQSKICTAKGMKTWKTRWRTLSGKEPRGHSRRAARKSPWRVARPLHKRARESVD